MVMPCTGTEPTTGSWIVPSGVTLALRAWPPLPKRATMVARKSSSLALTSMGVTVMPGTR
jgi:hypothetical protein